MSTNKTSIMLWTIREYDYANYIINGNLFALSTTLGSYHIGSSFTKTAGMEFISFFGTNFYGYKTDRYNVTTGESTYVLNINYNGITSNYTTLSTIGNTIRETTMPIFIPLSSFFNGTMATSFNYDYGTYKIVRRSPSIEITGRMILGHYDINRNNNSSNFYTSSTHPVISTASTSTYITYKNLFNTDSMKIVLTSLSYSTSNMTADPNTYYPTTRAAFPKFKSISASKTVQPAYYSTEKEAITSTYSVLYE